MKITVRCCFGISSVEALDIEDSITAEELKNILLKKINYKGDPTTVWLYYDEAKLFDDKVTLKDYGIADDSKLMAVIAGSRSHLGVKFANLNNASSMKKQKWTTTGPLWRVATPGLCLEGQCKTNNCAAKGQSVVIPIGYRKFDLLNDSKKQTTYCPICKEYVNPQTCAFNNCWWRFQGKVQENADDEPQDCSSDWRFADNSYNYFDQKMSETVTWRQLLIEAVETKPEP